VQIVGYRRRTAPEETAALLLASDGHVERLALSPGERLAYTLGDRHCAGVLTEEGHEACDAPRAPYCETHTVPWTVASNADSTEDHAVYLAAFAPDAFKVGVTRSWRLETRLREQGADRAAHVHTVSNGRIARDVESEIAASVGDRVRVAEKIEGLGRRLDEAAWTALIADFRVIESFDFDYGLDLDAQPVPETLLTGTVVGTKGRVLLVERAGTTYAVDMRDLVGRDVASGGDDREIQASLSRF